MSDFDRDPGRRAGNPKSTAVVGGHPIHPMLVPFPIVCFVGAFVTDIFFVYGAGLGWATASKWLLGFGLLTAALAASAGLADFKGDDRIRRLGVAVRHMIANVTAIVIAAVNLLIRVTTPDTEVSIGVFLSGLTVLILLYSGWLGGHLVFVHRVGVSDESSSGHHH
ncbi:MAG TPA: DUF2231 domain-containing protein [Sphingomicrobium sp.]|nr:DUF2231 domain-containing protein [Sphingomicrobium sp.]